METDLSGYEVTFKRNGLGIWEWRIETPDDDVLLADFGYMDKANAKKAALEAIERHRETERLDGNELREGLNA